MIAAFINRYAFEIALLVPTGPGVFIALGLYETALRSAS